VAGPRYLGTDVSPAALAVARRNAEALGLAGRVELVEGDLFEPLVRLGLRRRVDLVLANPPYVARGDAARLAPEIREHEPALALYSGTHGLDAIRRLATEAPAWLAPGGALLFECGDGQAEACLTLVRAQEAFGAAQTFHDLRGTPRAVLAERRRG
jgi:release factor glutamine methyltransferase